MKQFFIVAGGVITSIFLLSFTKQDVQTGIHLQDIFQQHPLKQDTTIPIKIQLEKTSFIDMPVLFIHDTALTTEAMKDKLGKDYGELMQFFTFHQLQPKKFLAWYYTTQPPWEMDVAVATDSIPAQLKGRIQSRIQPGGEVLIAHMWGPYEKVSNAYIKIEDWLKKNKRLANGRPFEIYVNDPSAVKSPSEIQTDVYQPIK